MTTLAGSLIFQAAMLFTNALDLSTAKDELNRKTQYDFTDGTGSNQADRIWHDQRTLTASSSENLDLAGSLSSVYGASITFATVKAIIIKAASGNTNDVVVGNAASNQFVGWFGAAAHTEAVKPGGISIHIAPATGWTVTAGTVDQLKILNGGAGTSVTYDIIIIGTSA